MTELEMMNKLEEARKASEDPCPFAICAYSNGSDIRYHRTFNDKALRPYLEKKGYWLCAIFENGHRVEA